MAGDFGARAEQAGLGAFRGAFQPARRPTWKEMRIRDRIGLVILVGGLVLVVVAAGSSSPVTGLIVLAAFLGFLGLIVFGFKSQTRANVGRELRFYDRGVAVVGTGGATMVPYRWEEMSVLQEITKHYRNGRYIRTTYVYTLSGPGVEASRVKGGTLDGFERPEAWGAEIQQQVTAVQLPPALATIRAGLSLEFGPFSLNAERLSSGDKSVAWSEVQAIKTERGFLSVKQQGRWLNMTTRAVSRIPNFFVFRTLADHLVEAARSSQQHGGAGHRS